MNKNQQYNGKWCNECQKKEKQCKCKEPHIVDKLSEYFILPLEPVAKTIYNKMDIKPTGKDYGTIFE